MDRAQVSIYKEYSTALKEVVAAKEAAIELSRQRGKAWSEYYTLMKKLKPLEEQMDPADVEWLKGESDFVNPKDVRMAPVKPKLKRTYADVSGEVIRKIKPDLDNIWVNPKELKTKAELVDLTD